MVFLMTSDFYFDFKTYPLKKNLDILSVNDYPEQKRTEYADVFE